ncbi:GRAM domain-containing protein 2B [Bagarius yarrelli]|uniref:GRAM domain-containing protein 2B n=1 Tax=Bagarius yarrelli TaxID=175774 RepID=A0A556V1I8_BAGYA|nr:GRAM domain-containing protein 2B [Bagarius yarrelli]
MKIAVGEKVVITPTRIPSPPHNLIRWAVNTTILLGPPSGVTVLPPYTDRASMDPSTLALELRNLLENDTGSYTLTIQRNAASVEGKTALYVLGVFITLSIVLERMRYEGAVDIFQTVKMLRTQRPAMVQTEVSFFSSMDYITAYWACVQETRSNLIPPMSKAGIGYPSHTLNHRYTSVFVKQVYTEYLFFVLFDKIVVSGNLTAVAFKVTEMEKKHSNWKQRHSEDSKKNMVDDRGLRPTSTIDEDGADYTDRLLNRSSFKNHSKSFLKHFPEISEIEDLINAFTCALKKEVLYHGKMYVSQQHVCFYSSVLLKETKVQIHVSGIQMIKKKNTARVVPNAISIITTTGDKYLFGSLRNRDVCFQVLNSICPQLQDGSAGGSPPMSSAENVHELEADMISSHSSQEDSPDPHRLSNSGQDKKKGNNSSFLSSASNISRVEGKNNSTSWNSPNRDGSSSEGNTGSSWVAMVTEKIRSFLLIGGTTNLNRLITVYLIL